MEVGLLGAGRIGAMHAGVLAGDPRVEQILVGDADSQRAEKVAAGVGGEARGIEGILASGPDAVVIAASTPAHAPLILASVEAGIPAFCEKPIALGYEHTLEVVEAVESSGAVLQIGFQRRFDAGYAEARRLVETGALGTIYSVRLATHDPEPPPEEYIAASGGISTSTTSTSCGGSRAARRTRFSPPAACSASTSSPGTPTWIPRRP
jgi:myo-inositol 2-dehydrogenase / D-chiro-inositol 1-dehydrogenase